MNKFITVPLAMFSLMYLIMSFIVYDPDPSMWTQDQRTVVMVVPLILLLFLIVILDEIKKQ